MTRDLMNDCGIKTVTGAKEFNIKLSNLDYL